MVAMGFIVENNRSSSASGLFFNDKSLAILCYNYYINLHSKPYKIVCAFHLAL